MSHIDEGRLHAWLDGALGPESGPEGAAMGHHLETCDECRTRLEEASALRERARSVLASADHPPSEAPAFAEIVARARSGARDTEDLPDSEAVRASADSVRSRIRRRTSRVGLAWAASITLAVGAGWLGRELALQRGRDLPDGLDRGRQSAPAVTEDEADIPERFEEGISAEQQEGLRRDLPAAKEPNAVESPARQKSETKAVSPAEEEVRAGRGEEAPKLDMLDRVDAELAEVAAPPAQPAADEAVGQAREQDIAHRARFAVRPLEPGRGVGHPALGCWRVDAGRDVPGAPARIRLTDERIPGQDDGSLRLETDSDRGLTGSAAAVWMPLGADSVWLSVPPRVFRLAQSDRVLDGLVMVLADPATVAPSEVRFTRVECPTP